MSGPVDVVIVGGGPVGTGLAIDLGLRGVSCALIERYESPQQIPKGQNLTQRTMEHFRAWGVEAGIRAARVMPPGYPTGGITAYESLMGQYSYSWWQRHRVRPYYFTDNERLPQYRTEAVLRARLADLPAVQTWRGWSAEEIQAGEGAVRVVVRPRAGGDPAVIEGQYLVGCDGSHSTVRDLVGFEEEHLDHNRRMVLLVFRSKELHRLLERFPDKSFFNVLHPALEGYWQFLGRVDVGEQFFFHMPVPDDATLDEGDCAAMVHRAVGAEFPIEFDYAGFWDLRIAYARTYRQGPVLIAGDAAHSHPPYGGYGINTGLEDARNLAWKLAGHLHGWGGPGLVDSYSAERQPVFDSTARDFIAALIENDRAFLAAHTPEGDRAAFEQAWEERKASAHAGVTRFEPHYEGSSIVFGPSGAHSGAVGSHEFTARAGHHLAPCELSGGRDLFDELGDGFALLSFGVPVTDFGRAAETIGLPLRVVEDSWTGERRRYGSKVILVRPDHYVAWTGNAVPPDPRAVLRRAAGWV